MKTEIIPNGTKVRIKNRSQWWTVCDTKLSRSGKTRRYCLRGMDIAVRPYLSREEREEMATSGKPVGTAEVPTFMWVNDWQIVETAD